MDAEDSLPLRKIAGQQFIIINKTDSDNFFPRIDKIVFLLYICIQSAEKMLYF